MHHGLGASLLSSAPSFFALHKGQTTEQYLAISRAMVFLRPKGKLHGGPWHIVRSGPGSFNVRGYEQGSVTKLECFLSSIAALFAFDVTMDEVM